jgi:hypothetical protein
MTKSFEFILPYSVTSKCLVISYDVIDVVIHNEKKQNKSTPVTLTTQQTSAENYIYNCNY